VKEPSINCHIVSRVLYMFIEFAMGFLRIFKHDAPRATIGHGLSSSETSLVV